MVDKALWEFSETEDILASAEDIVGKYIWGRYGRHGAEDARDIQIRHGLSPADFPLRRHGEPLQVSLYFETLTFLFLS